MKLLWLMIHLFLVSWTLRKLVFSTLEGRRERSSLYLYLWKHLNWYWLEQRVQFHLQKAFVRTAPSEERVQCRNSMLQATVNLVQNIFTCRLTTDDWWALRRWLLTEMLSSVLETQLSSAHGNLSWTICALVVHTEIPVYIICSSHMSPMLCLTGLMAHLE